MNLLLIRHAESQGNHEGRLQGRKEYPLTERGVRQAEALSVRIAGMGVDAVYSSPILRAYQTAEAVAGSSGLAVNVEERLQEYDFGELLSGLTWSEIREKQPEIVAALMANESDFPSYPGEEGRGAFRGRVCAALTEITERHGGANAVAVVTHAGPIVVYLMEVLGREYARPIPFTIENTSITTVEINGAAGGFLPPLVVTGLNDTCHLAGLEPKARLRLD